MAEFHSDKNHRQDSSLWLTFPSCTMLITFLNLSGLQNFHYQVKIIILSTLYVCYVDCATVI